MEAMASLQQEKGDGSVIPHFNTPAVIKHEKKSVACRTVAEVRLISLFIHWEYTLASEFN